MLSLGSGPDTSVYPVTIGQLRLRPVSSLLMEGAKMSGVPPPWTECGGVSSFVAPGAQGWAAVAASAHLPVPLGWTARDNHAPPPEARPASVAWTQCGCHPREMVLLVQFMLLTIWSHLSRDLLLFFKHRIHHLSHF